MLTLFHTPTSPFCEKVRRIMSYKGIEHRLELVDRARLSDYPAIAVGKVPAIDHDGRLVNDSTDVAHYLEAAFPDRPLIPADPVLAAQTHVMEDWADESLYFYEVTMRPSWEENARAVLPRFLPTFPDKTLAEVLGQVVPSVQEMTRTQGLGRKSRAAVVGDVARHFDAIGTLAAAGGWLVGGQITLADLAAAAQVNAILDSAEARALAAARPALRDWLSRIDEIAPDRGGADHA